MEILKVPDKIVWRKNIGQKTETSFYPSFIRDIEKKLPYFQENFTVEFISTNGDALKKFFLPLYIEEIASRPNFSLNRDTIADELLKKVEESGSYTLMIISQKNKVVSGILFSLKEKVLQIGYRATKKNIENIKHNATLSYWGEKLIFEYAKKLGAIELSYGKDTHPFQGKNIGRPLYKLKTGMKPRIPYPESHFSIIEIDCETLGTEEPTFFFANQTTDNFYKDCFFYFPKKTLNESFLREFQTVTAWSGLDLHVFPR